MPLIGFVSLVRPSASLVRAAAMGAIGRRRVAVVKEPDRNVPGRCGPSQDRR